MRILNDLLVPARQGSANPGGAEAAAVVAAAAGVQAGPDGSGSIADRQMIMEVNPSARHIVSSLPFHIVLVDRVLIRSGRDLPAAAVATASIARL